MEVKNGIIIDGVLHEMIDAFTINFGCSNVHCVRNAMSVR